MSLAATISDISTTSHVQERAGGEEHPMAWVRYDDQFHNHHKVTGVIAEDAGAIGLHALANTWTNAQKWKGFVPDHQPGVLICDKNRGADWAALLVKHRLWHRTDSMCPECKEEYAALPADLVGYVFHNAKEYRPPERDRTTPGTPAELSAKRRAAGRKGGKAAASKRQQNQANAANEQANQANAAAKEMQPPAGSDEATAGAAGYEGTTAAENAGSARPAETEDAARANEASGASIDSKLPFAGVSKTSNLSPAGVSPVPVPEPVVASNEATTPEKTSSPASPPRDFEPGPDGFVDEDPDSGEIPGLPPAPFSPKKPEPGSDDDPDWVKFWSLWPKKVSKSDARKSWAKAVKKVAPFVIIAGAERYRDLVARENRRPAHIKDPSGWLNGDRWTDEIPANGSGAAATGTDGIAGHGSRANVTDVDWSKGFKL